MYVRAGCHLCDEARQVLAEVLGGPEGASGAGRGGGSGWTEVDIEVGPDADALVARYGELVPVVTVDGVQQGYWRIDADRVRRALAGGRA